ncbi:MAG: apolipoprotein N-acyltransferase [Alteraurantiacibacter sp.]
MTGLPDQTDKPLLRVLRPSWWLALALGVISATGFQPLGLWPLAILAVGTFAWLVPQTRSLRHAALLGWLFGLGHFTLGNSWIATAFTYQGNMPAVLGWAAVPLVAVYLAIYPMLAAAGARWLAGTRGGLPSALAFAGCWILAEWLRSWVFTGYAWNPLAMVLLGPMDRPGLAALAPLMGSYALSGVVVLIGAGLVMLLGQRRWLQAGLGALLVLAGMLWPAPAAIPGRVPLTLVQPGIPQPRINDPLFYEANFNRLTGLSRRAVTPSARLVLWPESGMADYLEEGYPQAHYDRTTALGSPLYARSLIARAIGREALLLTGGTRLVFDDRRRLMGARNSVLALDGRGEIIGTYDKAHLVPYGEYLPLRPILEPIGLSRLVPGAIDFLPGPGPATLDLGAFGKAGVQVCYEIVFSGQVVDRANRPDYLTTGSNDGWFGKAGPPQHFAQARMRAIEEGLPVLRSTTTGISGVIDAHGVVRQWLGADEQGRIDTTIPRALPPTLFARLGNILALGWAALFLLLAFVAMRQRPL